ncbi:ATP-binding protein [Iningainema tapete]
MLKSKELEIQMQFLEGVTEYIDTLEATLQEIKDNGTITLKKINVALKYAHYIKNDAALMGFRILGDLAQRLQDLFIVLKTYKISWQFDNDLHNLLVFVLDWLRQIVRLHSEGYTIDEQWLTTFCYPVFEELYERLGAPIPEDAIAWRQETGDRMSSVYTDEGLIASINRLGDNQKLSNNISESSFKHSISPDTCLLTPDSSHQDLFSELNTQNHNYKMQIERLQKLIRNLSIRVKNMERENYELRLAYDKFTTKIATATYTQYQLEDNWTDNSDSSDYVEKDCYDELQILSQTVMKAVVKIQEITTDIQLSLEDTGKVNLLLNKTAQQLQKSFTQIRMRPLSDLVERFPLALSQMSVEYGKNVQLKIEGANTLIESNILEALDEPLMHLIINACQHGIEDQTIRRACGKPEQGLIEIKATHQGNRTLITVKDDGSGISPEKIRSRALAIGLEPKQLAQISDDELLSLIFESKLKVSEHTSTPFSRGISIVHSKLKQVQGDLKVDTIQGVGTTFTLSLPLIAP